MFFILYLGHAATIFCFLRLPPARSSGLSVTHADAGLWLHSAECGTLSKCLHEDGHETFCSFLIHGNTHFGMSVGHCEGGERKICVFSCCWFFFFIIALSRRESSPERCLKAGRSTKRLVGGHLLNGCLVNFFLVPTAVKLHTCTDFRERIACGFFHAAFVSVSRFLPCEHCDHLERARQAVWIRTERFASDIRKESSAVAGGERNKNVYCMNQ